MKGRPSTSYQPVLTITSGHIWSLGRSDSHMLGNYSRSHMEFLSTKSALSGEEKAFRTSFGSQNLSVNNIREKTRSKNEKK